VLLTRFGFASAALTSTHRRIIAQIAADTLAQIARSTWPPLCPVVEISGHEDEPGDPANYGVFGFRRAGAVVAVLGPLLEEGMNRLPPDKLPQGIDVQVSSEGPERPIRSNLTEDGRAMNRRVEVLVHMTPCQTA
jgi:outer membrane protein OmpA-like peptidoglycan-associated protein